MTERDVPYHSNGHTKIASGGLENVVEPMSANDLPWKEFVTRGLATRSVDLPPHRPGMVRGVHLTPSKYALSILNHGLLYGHHGSAYSTVYEWTYEQREEIGYTCSDPDHPKQGRGSVAIVFDFSDEQWRDHTSGKNLDGKIEPDLIVGVIDGWKELDESLKK